MMIMVLYCDRYNGYDQDLSMAMAVIVPAATNTFVPWTKNKDHGFDEDGGFDGDFDNDLQSWDEFTSSQSQKPFPSVETLGKGGGQADHTEERMGIFNLNSQTLQLTMSTIFNYLNFFFAEYGFQEPPPCRKTRDAEVENIKVLRGPVDFLAQDNLTLLLTFISNRSDYFVRGSWHLISHPYE